MPVVSGIELIQESRMLYPGLRFVVLTCHEDFEYVQTALRLGAIDYISKVRLEMEDYGQIFFRIQQSLTDGSQAGCQENSRQVKYAPYAKASASCVKEDASGSKEKWHRLERDWRALYWLFDRNEFQRLCGCTAGSGLPVHRVEELLMCAVSQVEASTHICIDTWLEIISIQAAIDWIHNYRDSLYSRAAQSTDLSETSICILKAVIYIQEHIATALHTKVVAGHVGMSRGYFCHCFKKLTGLTFKDYIRQERIRMAVQLLNRTNRSIGWISQAVGYSDVKYFSQVFHEQMHLYPSELRAQYRKRDK
jgi:two-component system response regulator YesN